MSAAPKLEDPQNLAHESSESVTEYATRGVRRRTRQNLRLVAPLRVRKASRGVFVIVLASLLGIGLLGMLLINTTLAQGAFTLSELKTTQAELSRTEATLTESVAALTAPIVLEQKARDLGMVPSTTPAFIEIPSGKVMGKAKPAPGVRIATPADATVGEAAEIPSDSGLPVAPGENYDPAATDEWSEPMLVDSQVVSEDLTLDAVPVE
ncbi:MAG: hypothetical protein WAO33_01290 [Candidatus Nanopelagicales bacterium]|jgi:hypothetical protein|nr:hypothetical protein [Actinomycetes bacterium]